MTALFHLLGSYFTNCKSLKKKWWSHHLNVCKAPCHFLMWRHKWNPKGKHFTSGYTPSPPSFSTVRQGLTKLCGLSLHLLCDPGRSWTGNPSASKYGVASAPRLSFHALYHFLSDIFHQLKLFVLVGSWHFWSIKSLSLFCPSYR